MIEFSRLSHSTLYFEGVQRWLRNFSFKLGAKSKAKSVQNENFAVSLITSYKNQDLHFMHVYENDAKQ